MEFNDPRWIGLEGAYHIPYDPRPALRLLEAGANYVAAWEELWGELHHQGDVGIASYAAVPHLVRIYRARDSRDWNTFALAGFIEIARLSGESPEVPDWLMPEYSAAWRELTNLALEQFQQAEGETILRAILGVLALAKRKRIVGRLLLDFTEEELVEMIAMAED